MTPPAPRPAALDTHELTNPTDPLQVAVCVRTHRTGHILLTCRPTWRSAGDGPDNEDTALLRPADALQVAAWLTEAAHALDSPAPPPVE